MKIGSVQFFKVVIVSAFLLLLMLPLVLAIVFGALYFGQRGRMREMEATLQAKTSSVVAGAPALRKPAETPVEAAPMPQTDDAGGAIAPSFSYQALYPQLYAKPPAKRTAEQDVCYLTFDDGPSEVTRQVLAVLAENNIKATFFVTGKNSELNEDVLREAAQAGHTIGVHTYSHDYTAIYASVEAFLADFDRIYRKIEDVTGTPPTIFRFAGGSVNLFSKDIYHAVVAEMLRRGFTFYDWNAAASDAVNGGLTRQQVVNNVASSIADQRRVVLLMHDRQDNATTAAALPEVIRLIEEKGLRFAPLTPEVEPVTYFYEG